MNDLRLTQPPRFWRVKWALCWVLSVPVSVAAQEPAPGAALPIQLQGPAGIVDLEFRYCPAGTMVPGRPGRKGARSVNVEPFYILNAEVSRGQFKSLVGDERAMLVEQRLGENLREFAQDPDLPVFYVAFDDVAHFCQEVDRLYLEQLSAELSSLELRRFRIPTHDEWQYACRSVTHVQEIAALPHFNGWPKTYKILDSITQAKCDEEWKEMGRTDPFTGSQEQVVDIVVTRHRADNPKPLEILQAFLKEGIGVERDYATTPDPPPLRQIRHSRPNAWNIHDMHNNVREWTLTCRSQSEAEQVWTRLLSAQQDQLYDQGLFFLAGGSFVDNAFSNSGWMKFATWGGFTQTIDGEAVGLDLATGGAVAFRLRDLDESDLFGDQMPGFRIVMRRGLRDDWQYVLRRETVLQQIDASAISKLFKKHRATVNDIAVSTEKASVLDVLQFYESLAHLRAGAPSQSQMLLAAIKSNQTGPPDLYLQSLSELVERDADALE